MTLMDDAPVADLYANSIRPWSIIRCRARAVEVSATVAIGFSQPIRLSLYILTYGGNLEERYPGSVQ